ncbi:MAG TPA: glutamine amidotransferase, partial [Gemmatimonadales bacterium]|nr:glutamine amidotransferase [Gemmatimonadales bacterium]
GVVVLTDGADNAGAGLGQAVLQLRAAGIPVYAVGVGRERFQADIEVSRVEVPRTALKGATVVADVLVSQRGYGGHTVRLTVEDHGRILATEPVRLSGDGEATVARIAFPVADAGPRALRFYIPPEAGEEIPENNARQALLEVRDHRARILYFEGEPRFEVKFVRRAVAEDRNLQVVVLQRTAENKFLRLDVDSADELAAGFPRTREELYGYDGVILGSVEASFFTHDQLRMLAEFAGQRGGGLLLLGGRRALAEGGYAGTPLADALPVQLEAPEEAEYFREIAIQPTPSGRAHPALQLAATLEESQARWGSLPALSVVNRVGRVKPGASVLLQGAVDGGEQPVLVHQRYGAGRVVAFPVQDTWVWQMHGDIPVEDLTHETLWRQVLRWLVSDVPGRVEVTVEQGRTAAGGQVRIASMVYDSGFLGLNHATTVARVTGPTGTERTVPLAWDVTRDGEYRAGVEILENGLHEVTVEARLGDRTVGTATAHFSAGDPAAEFFGAEMRRETLRRLAEETGGRFYTPETVASLPEDVRYTERGNTVLERFDLWDMPVVLLLVLGALATEWSVRRARGLA